MDGNPISLSSSHRKSIEKNRRDQMKALYCKLCSLLPNQSPKGVASMSDQLGEAANYIKNLQQRLEEMKKQKKNLSKVRKSAHFSSTSSSDVNSVAGELNLPRLEIHADSSTLNVVLITGFKHHYVFKESVRILREEGADVVCAGFSVVDQTHVFHTVSSQIGGSGLEGEGERICERFRNLVADDD